MTDPVPSIFSKAHTAKHVWMATDSLPEKETYAFLLSDEGMARFKTTGLDTVVTDLPSSLGTESSFYKNGMMKKEELPESISTSPSYQIYRMNSNDPLSPEMITDMIVSANKHEVNLVFSGDGMLAPTIYSKDALESAETMRATASGRKSSLSRQFNASSSDEGICRKQREIIDNELANNKDGILASGIGLIKQQHEKNLDKTVEAISDLEPKQRALIIHMGKGNLLDRNLDELLPAKTVARIEGPTPMHPKSHYCPVQSPQ